MRDRNVIFFSLIISVCIHGAFTSLYLNEMPHTAGSVLNSTNTHLRLVSLVPNSASIYDDFNNVKNGNSIILTRGAGVSIERPQALRAMSNDGQGPRFYTPSEVSIPAFPVGEWVVDWSLWPNEKPQSIKFRLWVSDQGKIVQWELMDKPEELLQIKGALATIGDTPMNPAILNGSPVASVQNIELEFFPD